MGLGLDAACLWQATLGVGAAMELDSSVDLDSWETNRTRCFFKKALVNASTAEASRGMRDMLDCILVEL